MKTFVKLSAFLFIFLTSVSRANPIMMFFITEVQLDEDNSHGWKMELFNLDTYQRMFLKNYSNANALDGQRMLIQMKKGHTQ
ncbi:MAG: hypothetical protein P8184_21600, partial [Calditrichia bacterium]